MAPEIYASNNNPKNPQNEVNLPLRDTQGISASKMFMSHITIHRSGVILALYLIVLEIIFLSFGVALRLPLVFFTFSLDTTVTLNLVSTIANIGLILIKILFMIIIITQWLENYYEVRPGKIIFKTGFFSRTERELDCTHVTKVNLTQGIIGRLFNFGTINLYRSTTDEWFSLSKIPNPHRNLHLVQKILANKNIEITITDDFLKMSKL